MMRQAREVRLRAAFARPASCVFGLSVLIGLGGCVTTGQQAASEAELLAEIRARSGELRTRISHAERRAEGLRTKVRASSRLADEVRSDLRSAGIKVSARGAAVVVAIAGRLLFAPGDAELRQEAKARLEDVARLLNSKLTDRRVHVEGHSDTSTPRRTAGEYPTNWEVSAARAVAVARYLVETCGLDPERVSVAAYGDTRPVAPNDTDEGRAANRRVEIVLLPPIQTARVSIRIE